MLGQYLCLVVAGILFLHSVQGEYKRVCYFANWTQYRPGIGKFTPDNIDPTLCTHLIYAFAKVETSQLKMVEWNDDQFYQKFNALKSRNPGLKTLIAVGGWNAASKGFSDMSLTAANRAKFIRATIVFLKTHGFDGVDLDWEYPTQREGARPQDKANFVSLLKEFVRAFNYEARATGRPRYLLTAAVAAGKKTIDKAYNVAEVARSLDFINLMAYDLHGAWEKTTGINSPLTGRHGETGDDLYLNMEYAANYWVQQGTPKHKLIIGMAMYGRTFTLADPVKTHVGAPAVGAGTAGKFTRENGFMAYYEICQMQDTGAGVNHWQADQKVPYYVNGKLWVGYDNVKSIYDKAMWVRNNNYGGAMIWSLDSDDFGKTCRSSRRTFPLLRVINEVLRSGIPPTTPVWTTSSWKTRKGPKTTTIKPRTTTHSNTAFTCNGRADGFYRDPSQCSRFYRCVGGKAFHYQCAPPLMFNKTTKICDWAHNVVCEYAWWF